MSYRQPFTYDGHAFDGYTVVAADTPRPVIDPYDTPHAVFVYGSHPDDNIHVRVLADDGETAYIAYRERFHHYANAVDRDGQFWRVRCVVPAQLRR
jgi:hypothetical protein